MATPPPLYAGIGARKTPIDALAIMREVGLRLAEQGWTLRTGGAQGADQAFLEGCLRAAPRVELMLPWPGFNGHQRAWQGQPHRHAYEIAAAHHPAWQRCSEAAKHLLARNVHVLLGADLATPVSMVVAWTPSGRLDGGTGHALRVAEAFGITEVRNLAAMPDRMRIMRFVGQPRLGEIPYPCPPEPFDDDAPAAQAA